LFPNNPDRVLRNAPKPPTDPSGTEIDAIRAAADPQGEAVQTPVTPVTPVSAEGLMSLYNQIKQDTQTLDATSTQRLQKRVRKLANAAQVSFAECALLKNRNQFLTEANNEAKVRRSTKPVVLGKGKAKVMSFEDLEVARAARAAKDAVKNKGKRGRKRKNTEPEASGAELEPEVGVVSSTKKVKTGKGTRIRRRRSTAVEASEPEAEPEAEPEPQPEFVPWRAPVARMY